MHVEGDGNLRFDENDDSFEGFDLSALDRSIVYRRSSFADMPALPSAGRRLPRDSPGCQDDDPNHDLGGTWSNER